MPLAGWPKVAAEYLLHRGAVHVQLRVGLLLAADADFDFILGGNVGDVLHAHLAFGLLRMQEGCADTVEWRRLGKLDRHQRAAFEVDAVIQAP